MAKYCAREDKKERNKTKDRVREALGAILVIVALVNRIVFHEADSDIVFDASGKAVVIILILIFFLICYIQSNKMDKG